MFDVVRRAVSENQSSDALPRLKTSGKDSTKLHNDLPEIVMSLLEQGRENNNNDHDRNSNILRIQKQCGKTLNKVSSAHWR